MEGFFKNGGAFVTATVGAAVGLGNVFRFPALACLHGGGFILVYLLLVLGLGLPLFVCETALGRSLGGEFAFGVGKKGLLAARLCGVNALLILPVYLLLTALVLKTAVSSSGFVVDGAASRLFFFCLVFTLSLWLFFRGKLSGLLSTAGVVLSCGVVLLIALLFLFSNPSGMLKIFEIRTSAFFSILFWRDVVGQVFFSLSVMTGVLPVFGERLHRGASLPLCALSVVLTDFAVSLAATFIYAGVEGDKSGLLSAFRVYPAAFCSLFGSFGTLVTFLFFAGLGLLCADSVLAYMQSVFALIGRGRVENFLPIVLAVAFFGAGLTFQKDLFALTFLDRAVIPIFTLLVGMLEGFAVGGAVKEGHICASRGGGFRGALRGYTVFLLPACFFALIILEIFT